MSKLDYYRFIARSRWLVAFQRETLGGVCERMARRRRGAPFLLFEGESISFREFNRLVNRRANYFRQQGVKRGEVVVLMMENRPEYLATLTGLAKLGAVTAAINYNLVGQGLADCMGTAGAGRAVIGAECLEAYRDALPLMERPPRDTYVDTRWPGGGDAASVAGGQDLNAALLQASGANPRGIELRSRAEFMYIYTSGTTGLPKAARISHSRWCGAGISLGGYVLRLRRRDTLYSCLPLYHSNGALVAFSSALSNGATLALSRRFSASRFWDEVRESGATGFVYIGELLRYLMNRPPSPGDRSHAVTRILGNGLRPEIWAAFQARFGIGHIREFYASTEGNGATINMDDVPGSAGKPLTKAGDNLRLVRFDVETEERILDDRGFHQLCETGEAGELLAEVRPLNPFAGYTNSEATEKKLLRDVFVEGDMYYRTGDLLRKDAQGYYYFIDRIGDTFRWKGENVSTNEVAGVLAGFPGLAFANVYGVQIAGTDGRAGMACLTFDPGEEFQASAFHRFAAAGLPSYAMPAFVRLVPDAQMTGTFKLRKTDLQRDGFDPERVADLVYYRDSASETYRELTGADFRRIQSGELRF